MKALTVWQPWASLLAIEAKRYETRGWETSYRGPIAIHAAVKPVHESLTGLLLGAETYAAVIAALADRYRQGHPSDLPTGAIIAVAELIGCHEIRDDGSGKKLRAYIQRPNYRQEYIQGNELLFGDFTPGRFAWELKSVRMLDKPIPAKGRQGLWNFEAA